MNEGDQKPSYWQRLKNHAGVPYASIMTFLFIFAGFSNNNWKAGVITGVIFSIALWCCVLLTARGSE